MNTTNVPTINKGGRPRKVGKTHKYIVPPDLEPLIEEKGIDYVWSAALAYDRIINSVHSDCLCST